MFECFQSSNIGAVWNPKGVSFPSSLRCPHPSFLPSFVFVTALSHSPGFFVTTNGLYFSLAILSLVFDSLCQSLCSLEDFSSAYGSTVKWKSYLLLTRVIQIVLPLKVASFCELHPLLIYKIKRVIVPFLLRGLVINWNNAYKIPITTCLAISNF